MNNGETIAIKVNGNYFDISLNGEVKGEIEVTLDTTPGAMEGQGTVDEPFIIMSIEDLVWFSRQVNGYKDENNKDVAGVDYVEKYVELGKTLDFNSDLSYVNPNTTEYDTYLGGDGTKGLKEQLTNGLGFRPIGESASKCFSGNFDGKGNSLNNIYINKAYDYVGLFGMIERRTTIIQNVSLSGKIVGQNSVGGILGESYNGSAQIINCNNYAKIEGNSSVGGIIGSMAGASQISVKNCNNYGEVMGNATNTDTKVGGIAGVGQLISGCANYGTVSGYKYSGGITGVSGTIFECINDGIVNGNEYVGGISGHCSNGGLVERSYNNGSVNGKKSVGGIYGALYRGGSVICAYNSGKITGEQYVGGIAGDCSDSWGRDTASSNCYNIGIIKGNTDVGQVIGKLATDTTQYYTNMYYLNTLGNNGISNLDDIEGVVEGKTANELKQESFLNLLNATHTHTVGGTNTDYTSKCWVADTQNINSGYPIFSYQSPNSEE